MTNEEAIKLISMIDVCDYELHAHTHWCSFDDDMEEALQLAIKGLKSLEAWEKVKEEISEAYKDFQNDDTCIANGINICRRIIDKHLKEVENDS